VQRAVGVPAGRLTLLGLPIHAAPAADDPLNVLSRAGPVDRQQPFLCFGHRDTGELADLGVGQLAARKGLRQPRQSTQGTSYSDVLPRRARSEPYAPREPRRTRAEAAIPSGRLAARSSRLSRKAVKLKITRTSIDDEGRETARDANGETPTARGANESRSEPTTARPRRATLRTIAAYEHSKRNGRTISANHNRPKRAAAPGRAPAVAVLLPGPEPRLPPRGGDSGLPTGGPKLYRPYCPEQESSLRIPASWFRPETAGILAAPTRVPSRRLSRTNGEQER
jgi:hypothetical protein